VEEDETGVRGDFGEEGDWVELRSLLRVTYETGERWRGMF